MRALKYLFLVLFFVPCSFTQDDGTTPVRTTNPMFRQVDTWTDVRAYGAHPDSSGDWNVSKIQDAIDNRTRGIVYIPDGMWSLDTTLVMRDSTALFLSPGTTLKMEAGNDYNVIEMKPKARLNGNGGKIDVSAVVGFSKAAVYFDGKDTYQGVYYWDQEFNCQVSNMVIINDEFTGYAFHLFADSVHQEDVSYVMVDGCMTYGFDKGIYLEKLTDASPDTLSWINSNTFNNIHIYWAKYGIYLDTNGVLGWNIYQNIFDNIQFAVHIDTTVLAIYADGKNNFFNMMVMDFNVHSTRTTGIEVNTGAQHNTFIVPSRNTFVVEDNGTNNNYYGAHFMSIPKLVVGTIGTLDGNEVLRIYKGSAETATPHASSGVIIEDDVHVVVQFLTPNNKIQGIYFGDPQDNADGQIYYDHLLTNMKIFTDGVQSLVIDSDRTYNTNIFYSSGIDTIASNTTISLGRYQNFVITGTTQIDSVNTGGAFPSGGICTLEFTGSVTVTDGKNLILAGSFSATANDILVLQRRVNKYFELSRSAN